MIEALKQSISQVPPGRWVVGVSGGADSTALLRLLRMRDDLELFVAHLNHETRGTESDRDEAFVRELSGEMGLPVETIRLSELSMDQQNIEWSLPDTKGLCVDMSGLLESFARVLKNVSAKYRFARFVHFGNTIGKYGCAGVLLAHHFDDVIETVFQRLSRGSSVGGLTGIGVEARVQGVRVIRPLLGHKPEELKEFLRSIDQCWREDESNESLEYGRNRVRRLFREAPGLVKSLDVLRGASIDLKNWIDANAPKLNVRFSARALASLPAILANESARRWLVNIGCPQDRIEPLHLQALADMAKDASVSPRYTFPGNVIVGRKSGWIERIG